MTAFAPHDHRPQPLLRSRGALIAFGLILAVAFPLSIAGLAWFLLLGA